MLLEELYKINAFSFDEEKKDLRAVIHLNVDHDIFKGHFPNNPILPGVCQIEIVSELLGKHYGKDYNLSAAKNIKFLSVVNPIVNKELVFQVQIFEQNDIRIVKVISSVLNGDICFKLNGTFI